MANAKAVPVLMHHHVSPSPGMITVSPENFESQIRWLADDGWTSLTIDQFNGFLDGKPVPKKSILITFDDGYLDNWIYAHPILARYGMRATVFLVSDWMGQGEVRAPAGNGAAVPTIPDHRGCEDLIYNQHRADDVMMRWSEARAAMAAGTLEFHSHGHTHTRWLRRNAEPQVKYDGIRNDLVIARQRLTEELGSASDTLCWPYGDFDDGYLAVAREQGYRHLHTTHPFGRNVAGGNREHIYRFAIRNRPAAWLRKRITASYNPVIAPFFNGFKARKKGLPPGR